MKTSFGNVKIVRAHWREDGATVGNVTVMGYKSHYNRRHPYPKNTMRIKVLPREKAAIVALRYNCGYPINMIAAQLGRSASFVHRCTEANKWFNHHKIDMRKLPDKVRKRCSAVRWKKLQDLWAGWEAFIFGEVDKPP